MSDRKVKVVWSHDSGGNELTAKQINVVLGLLELTAKQINVVLGLLKRLPGYQEEVYEWRVEKHEAEPLIFNGKVLCQPRPTVFFFGETRVKDEAGALILCRENYLFEIGPRGGLTQLMGRKQKYLGRSK
jgi:hypothetical protein